MRISKKGQIVIPAKMRERLNIKPGMEVNFRIRGQFLIVELDTDVEANIKYLRGLDLDTEGLDESQLRDIVRDLVYQQFYIGDNQLTDRIGKRIIKIRGADAIVQEIINVFVFASNDWLKGNPVDTLKQLATDFELDFPTIISKFSEKMKAMLLGGEDLIKLMGGQVIYAMGVGEILSQFRTRIGDIVTDNLFKEAKERGYISKLSYETVEDLITKSLADEYSILMNLKVLKFFAQVSLKSVGERVYNKLSKEMLDSYSGEITPEHIIKRRERREKRKNKGMAVEDKGAADAKFISPSEEELDELKEFEFPEIDDDDAKTESPSEEDIDVPDMPDFDF